jgi:hypothetical protein
LKCFKSKYLKHFRFNDKNKQKRIFRSKSLPNTQASIQNSTLIRKWKTFSNFNDFSKSNCFLNDKPPEYELAMNVSYTTKNVPPCYLMVLRNQKEQKKNVDAQVEELNVINL